MSIRDTVFLASTGVCGGRSFVLLEVDWPARHGTRTTANKGTAATDRIGRGIVRDIVISKRKRATKRSFEIKRLQLVVSLLDFNLEESGLRVAVAAAQQIRPHVFVVDFPLRRAVDNRHGIAACGSAVMGCV